MTALVFHGPNKRKLWQLENNVHIRLGIDLEVIGRKRQSCELRELLGGMAVATDDD
jgi:hypothetical protein